MKSYPLRRTLAFWTLFSIPVILLPAGAQEQTQPAPPEAKTEAAPPTKAADAGELQIGPATRIAPNPVQNNLMQVPVQNNAVPPVGYNEYGNGGQAYRFNRDNRADEERQKLETRLRSLMVNLGVKETVTQDALLNYLEQDEKGKSLVRDTARRLVAGLRRNLPPERQKELISAYKSALDDEKERRKQSQASLDAKIGYSTNPNLEALLWVVGVLGDGFVPLPLGQIANRMGPPRYDNNDTLLAARQAPNSNAAVNGLVVDGNNFVVQKVATTGTIIGVVDSKTDESIGLKDDTGRVEYFSVAWIVDGTGKLGPDRRALEDLTRVTTGQKVRLKWVWLDRRRLHSVTSADDAVAADTFKEKP